MTPHNNTIFIVLVFFLPLSSASAEPETRINNVYYMVDGNTAADIWADTIAKSPVLENARRRVARTKWNVNWQFWWSDNESSCDITQVTTKLEVIYTLPRLNQASSAPDSVIAHWEKYKAALFSHEQGHKERGFKAAMEIENQISSMAPRRSCKQLELDANNIGKSVIDKYSRIEKEYDKSTNHGLNTGVVFP